MYYFFNLVFLLYYMFMYFLFHNGVCSAFNISSKKKRKRILEYLWFENVKKTKRLGHVYYANKIFTIVYAVIAVVVITVGWVRIFKVPVFCLMCVLSAYMIPLNFYGWIHNNRCEYGKSFFIWAKQKNTTGKYHSSIIDILWSILPAFIMYFEILCFL